MSLCTHRYRDQERTCPYAAVGESGLCLWHNPSVRKDDAYVVDLLTTVDQAAGGDLAEFCLVGLRWQGAHAPLRNLRCADLRDSDLSGSDLNGCDLTGANLRRANLRHCDLRGAHLAGADLTGTNLIDADLSDADLTGVVLDGTLLMGADVTGATLAGAVVRSFRWNRRTRFVGVKGFEPRLDDGAEIPTQAFPAPLALATGPAPSMLEDANPDDDRTREFVSVVAPSENLEAFATTKMVRKADHPVAAPRVSRWQIATRIAAGFVLAGAGVGIGLVVGRGSMSGDPSVLALTAAQRQNANLTSQHEADLAEMRRVQDRERELDAKAAALAQELTLRRAELEAVRGTLREAQQEIAIRQGVEDRAALLGLSVQELERINGDLARHGSRQERLGRVLSDGAERLEQERHELVETLTRERVDTQRLTALDAEVSRLRAAQAQAVREREQLTEQNRKLVGDLLASQRDIERYLARLDSTHLQDALAGTVGEGAAPLLPVVAGTPIALSGDYLLTLRVDRGSQPGTVQTRVVVQRPASAANPEIVVVLFDKESRPLRRVAYSFPHVDGNSPLVSSTTVTACDRFPAFAQVIVTPGLDGVTAAR